MSVRIKTPNLDDIFLKWKNSAVRKNRKKMEKEFGTKGAVFSLDAISAAETIKDTMKEAAIYFAIKKTLGAEKAKGKEENLMQADRVSRDTYYLFRGEIDKESWKGKDMVPMYDSITEVSCKTCKGKGYSEDKCKNCKGTGKIQEEILVLNEKEEKQKKTFTYPCGNCYGNGFLPIQCKECGGHKNLYKSQVLPVPFKTVVTGVPVLHSSAQTKYEKEIEKDLHQVIEEVEGIKFSDFKTLDQKAEASLGYWNKNIKKTISNAESDYKKYDKDDSVKIVSQVSLFPMIQMTGSTKRGNSFEIYSIGSEKKFMIYSNF